MEPYSARSSYRRTSMTVTRGAPRAAPYSTSVASASRLIESSSGTAPPGDDGDADGECVASPFASIGWTPSTSSSASSRVRASIALRSDASAAPRGGASGAAAARPPSITAHRVNPSCTATAAAWLALWPCVLTNTMLDRFVGGSNPVRSSQCVCRLRSARASSPAGTRAIRSLPLNSRSGASSSELSRTSTSTGRTLLLSTSSQNADGERRAYAPRPARMLGRLPSPRAPPLFSRDFCSASFCARSTRIDHAMRERHTAVVRDPPMLVMCMATTRARGRERGKRPDPRARRECTTNEPARIPIEGENNVASKRCDESRV